MYQVPNCPPPPLGLLLQDSDQRACDEVIADLVAAGAGGFTVDCDVRLRREGRAFRFAALIRAGGDTDRAESKGLHPPHVGRK